MSPVTVFTISNCPYCKQVKNALEECSLPYSEISLSIYPQKKKDLRGLTDGCKVSVPQTFVNSKWIGGVDETLSFIRDLANRCWNSGSTLEGYLARDLGPKTTSNGSQTARLMLPILEEEEADHSIGEVEDAFGENDDSAGGNTTARGGAGPLSAGVDRRYTSTTDILRIPFPDGAVLSVSQTTEKLKAILPYGKRRYNFTTYKNTTTAEEFVDSIVETYKIPRTEAEDFGKLLQKHQIIHHVLGNQKGLPFGDTNACFVRLQVFNRPAILNSYRIWPGSSSPAHPQEVMGRLIPLLGKIEAAVIEQDGNINYRIAYMCSDFPAFEDLICELQIVDLSELEGSEMVAFALNVYNMMRKYSFMRLGVPVSESGRMAFLTKVCFNVGGHVFSFQEWVDGILRGNRKSPVTKTYAFCRKDARLPLALRVGEHYAKDCRIHFAIHCWSRSRRSPPVKTFTANNIEEELEFVAHSFCEEDDNVAFSINEKKMRLAPVFRYYKSDFLLHQRSIPRFVLGLLHGTRREKLNRFLNSGRRKDRSLKMSSRAEDWTLGVSDFVAFEASRLNANVRKMGKYVRSTTSGASSKRERSSRGGSLRGSAVSGCSDDDSSAYSSTPSQSSWTSLGRLLPARRGSGGKVKRNKTDSIPKPFQRCRNDQLDPTVPVDEMVSNVSSTSVASSNASEFYCGGSFEDTAHFRSTYRASAA